MKNFVIEPPLPVLIPIIGEQDYFPVRRVYCVGRNYADHVREMGGDPSTSSPIFFSKSRETLVKSGASLPFPPMTDNLHHEVELVVAMKSPTEIFGYGVGLDMTRRDIQAVARSKGGPWDMAKNFDHSAPCGPLMRTEDFTLGDQGIRVSVNGETRQSSTLGHMIWSVEEIITHLNRTVDVQAGDLIYTGTPDGVGPVKAGETMVAEIDGLAALRITYDS